MVVYVERGVGAGAAIKLVLEDDRSDTIEQVKQQIHEEQGTQEGEMLVLTFDGKRLNDSATVEECGIGPGSTLRLDENGITFKKLSRWHAPPDKLPAASDCCACRWRSAALRVVSRACSHWTAASWP